MTTPAQIAFAALQASARNFAGLTNARALILQAKNIRRQRYEERVEETRQEHLATEVSQMGLADAELKLPAMLCVELQQAA